MGDGVPIARSRSRAGADGDLAPFVGHRPCCYRARVSAVSLCSVSYKISGAEPHALNDLPTVESILLDAARKAGLTAVSSAHHRFEPQGLSAVVAAFVSIVLVGGLFSACSNLSRSSGEADPTSTSHSGSSRSYRHRPVYGGGGGGVGK